ncbi:unnamed protein product [Gordionus sp. m RMFG-2023]
MHSSKLTSLLITLLILLEYTQLYYQYLVFTKSNSLLSDQQHNHQQLDKRSINTSLLRSPNCPKMCLCMSLKDFNPPNLNKYAPTSHSSMSFPTKNIPNSSFVIMQNNMPSVGTQVICSKTDLRILPRDLPAETVKLDVSQNEISFIPSRAFENLPITDLILDDNEIREIKPYSFIGLKKLKNLLMKNNPLDVLGQNSMSGINGSKTINLGSNHIDRIEREAFEDTENIESINLSGNPLTYVKTKAFRGLRNVGYLILSSSGLKYLEPGCFDGLHNVSHLTMTRVPLSNIEPNTFRGLRKVGTLELKHAKVGKIKEYAFRGSEDINRLILSDIELEYLDKRAFRGMILTTVKDAKDGLDKKFMMEKVDLSRNNLKYVDPLIFVDLEKNTKVVDLSDNPISCGDCNMSWVGLASYFYGHNQPSLGSYDSSRTTPKGGSDQNLISDKKIIDLSNFTNTIKFNPHHISQLKCFTPLHLKGKLVKDVSFYNEFGCLLTARELAERLDIDLSSGTSMDCYFISSYLLLISVLIPLML